MLFDTPVYFLFLALVVIAYWRLGWRNQNRLLLAASYFFYGWWDWRFLLLMIGSTVLDYFIAIAIADSPNQRRRRLLLILSLTINFSFLGFFKYFNFFVDSFQNVLDVVGVHHIPVALLQIILPPGISFYTFQEVAYIVDVYGKKLKPARSLLDYGLFISLFPHLIAGPIQRPGHLLPQVQRERRLDWHNFFDGCVLIVSGLFRKCVIADQCAVLANAAFAGHFGANVVSSLIGVCAFAFQIYGDFSGYSDIARGSAHLLGFHFMVNFRQPYLAASLQDFWRRWHISLSTWLRDYLYIPLGGSRHGERQTYRNLFLTMLLGGLWHGANWTFVVWGALHGSWLAIERFFLGTRDNLKPSMLTRVFTLVVVGLGWVFFRARSLHEAVVFLGGLGRWEWRSGFGAALVALAALASVMLLMDLRLETNDEEYVFQKSRVPVPVVAATALLALLICFGATDSNAFIYFQF